MSKAKILLVEDTKAQGSSTKGFLEVVGYDVVWVEDGMTAIKTAKSEKVDLILLDGFRCSHGRWAAQDRIPVPERAHRQVQPPSGDRG